MPGGGITKAITPSSIHQSYTYRQTCTRMNWEGLIAVVVIYSVSSRFLDKMLKDAPWLYNLCSTVLDW